LAGSGHVISRDPDYCGMSLSWIAVVTVSFFVAQMGMAGSSLVCWGEAFSFSTAGIPQTGYGQVLLAGPTVLFSAVRA
jgi:hypothetical protein